ncbi:MAG TPA: MBL fold metallo-hydrolase [bacterium]|nr:MBL fold metallo-hydrolase [bacterium]
MKIERFTVGPLMTNCYLVTCEKTNESVIIDPGDVSSDLLIKVKEHTLKAILLTHGHFDHIGGVRALIDETGVESLLVHTLDAPMLTDPHLNGSFMVGVPISACEPSGYLTEGEDVVFGESSLKVIHTPGHSAGGVSFVSDEEFVIAGDTLFRLSIGRWDLPGGDYATLIKTLKEKFSTMPVSTKVYPGHGEITDIGFEKTHNQFLLNA